MTTHDEMGDLVVWHRDGTSSRYALREILPDYWRFELSAETRPDMAVPLFPMDEIEIVRRKPHV
jgi:hypothetical protein